MWGAIIAAVVLTALVILILRGIRGHIRSGDTSEKLDGIGNPGTDGFPDS